MTGNGEIFVLKSILQYTIYLVNLDPTVGHEIKKTRPCVVLSPNEMNKHLKTVMIAPLTTKSHSYPTRISVNLQGKDGWVVLDQIRTIDRLRMIKKIGSLNEKIIFEIKAILQEMLVD